MIRHQGLLLPPSLRDWLPEEHLAFFLSDAIDAMDLGAFDARYGDEGPGNQAFDPRMMLKVLVYAHTTGTFTSDVQELIPLMEQIQQTAGEYPEKALADAGYRSESNLKRLEDHGIEGMSHWVVGRTVSRRSRIPRTKPRVGWPRR